MQTAARRADILAQMTCLPDWVLDEAGQAWEREGRILVLPEACDRFYPRFQFDGEMNPHPAMAPILAALPPAMDNWARAAWFVTPHPLLGGERPMDKLGDPASAVAAAWEIGELRMAS